MYVPIHRGLTYLCSRNSSILCKSRVFSPFYFSTDSENEHLSTPAFSELLMHKYQFPPQSASQFASLITTLKKPQNSNSILSFLKDSGFSVTQMEKILKACPELLATNLERIIKPKIKIFHDFGFSEKDIVEMVSTAPWILHSSAKNTIVPGLSVLKGVLGSNAEVARFSKISGWYLNHDLEKILLPNVEILKSCGIPMDRIVWLMYHFPRLMLLKPENMKELINRADRMGVDRSSKMYIHAVRVFSSMSNETWEHKLKIFRDLGFSEDEILRVFRMQPIVFSTSEKKINNLKEVLLATGKYDVSCIVNSPASLTRSIEKRLKPRFEVLGILERKKLIETWPGFSTLYKMTDEKFYERFVGPFLNQVGEVYMAKECL